MRERDQGILYRVGSQNGNQSIGRQRWEKWTGAIRGMETWTAERRSQTVEGGDQRPGRRSPVRL